MPEIRRTGLLGRLLGLMHPGEARSAAITADGLKLTFPSRTTTIAFDDLEKASVKPGWFRDRIRFDHASRAETISGVARKDAHAFAEAIEAVRENWWRQKIAARKDAIRSAHDRLVQMKDPPGYVTMSAGSALVQSAREAVSGLRSRWPAKLSRHPSIRMLEALHAFLAASERTRAEANRIFVENELTRLKGFFDRIESRPLTEEQRRAVVTDEERNLVVAAAGSGKTSVIVAKAGWLIRRGLHPSELLLLAFARDARTEMEERIHKRLGRKSGKDITVRTFHGLGMAIIGEAEDRKPSLAKVAENNQALLDLLKKFIGEMLQDGERAGHLRSWFQSQHAPYRSAHEFSNWGEYWDYIRQNDIRSLNRDTVKSYEECEIANFLYLNGVPYAYEAPYEHDTATSRHRQYKPDFHLPEAGIYIEHFGLNKAGNPAPFINRGEYLRGMAWKRQLHKDRGTTLIETFSHEHASGTLIPNLERKLIDHGVTLTPIPDDEIFAVLEKQKRVDPFTRLVATFLQHFKGARLTFEDLAGRIDNLASDRTRAHAFLKVFRPIFERYQATLAEAREIDFHDMINRATEHVETGRWQSPFRYILVDEFQDISPGRARLLKALLEQSPENQLFAVGDDWQAIYRFGGSDIAIMREFEEWFGHSERIDLTTTFRCPDHITTVATDFVLKNPAQLSKTVHAVRQADGPAVHAALSGEGNRPLLDTAFDRVAANTATCDEKSTVLLLGRYRYNRPKNMNSLQRRFPGLDVSYKTVHGSKGLEADYVVVLSLCSGQYGFPSEIVDDPLLDLVLGTPESHPNAEERRLFYVALTRAMRQVFLLAEDGPPSSFVLELIRDFPDIPVFGKPPDTEAPCPSCKKGQLQRRENRRGGGSFYGCTNWPLCEHTQRPCPACGKGLVTRSGDTFRCRDCNQDIWSCPRCDDGWLETRMGRHGRFLGCTNWPTCEFTRNSRMVSRTKGDLHGNL